MSTDTDDQKKMAVFRTMARAWHEQDWDTCASLFAPDGVLHSKMLAPIEGRDTIHARISKLGGDHKRVTLHIHRMGVIDGVLFVDHISALKRNMIMRRLAKEQRTKGR